MKKVLALMLAVMMILSTVSFAAPQMVDTAIDVSEVFEEASVSEAPNSQAELEADDLGVLIVNVDFENAETGLVVPTSTTLLASEVGTTNYPEGFPNLYFKTTQKTLTVVENEDGTKSGEWVVDDAGYGKIGFHTMNPNLMPEGIYTLKGDVKWNSCKKDDTDVKTPSFNIVWTPNKDNGVWFDGENNIIHNPSKTTDAETGFITYSATRGYYENELIKASAVKDENGTTYPYPFKGFGKVALYYDLGNAAFTSANLTVDNIKLYYKAPDAVVTIDYPDSSMDDVVINAVAGKTVIDLSKYVCASDSTKSFLGWKVKGTTSTVATSYTPAQTGNITLVPAYDYYVPGLGFEGTEFESAEDFQNKISKDNSNNKAEKPGQGNPVITTSVDKEAGTVIFDLDYSDDITFPTHTKINTHFLQQINSSKVINTNSIKGIEYRYRLVAPEGVENASKYFTTSGNIDTKVYFQVNWPEGDTETPCYNNEKIDGWHWGECISTTKTLVNKGTDYNGEWLTAKIDLDSVANTAHSDKVNRYYWKEADMCKDFRIQFMSNVYAGGNCAIEVDYVRFILADGMTAASPELVSYDFYDLRKGYIDVTFAEKLEGFDGTKVAGITGSNIFQNSELIENEDGTATYRLYASSSLTDVTVTFPKVALTDDGIIYLPAGLAGVSHKYTLAEAAENANGENLFPNGDFSNPYYNIFAKISHTTSKIVDGKLVVTLTDAAAEWSTLTAESSIKVKPNTRYYIDLDVDFTKDAEGNPHAANDKASEVATLYFPVLDGAMHFAKNNINADARIGTLNYIPSSANTASHFYFNKNTLGKDEKNITKAIHIMTPEYYANKENINFSTAATGWEAYKNTFFDKGSLYIQPCFTSGLTNGIFSKNDKNVIPALKGFEYQVKSIVVKEMYPISLMDGETLLDTYYAAKDVPLVLPATADFIGVDGAAIVGWTDGENTYVSGDEFVLTQAGAVTLTAITESAPLTSNEIAIRTDSYTGIRFKASVSNELKLNEKTTELGFIVTRKVMLDNAGISADSFTTDSGVMYVSGKTYVKGSFNKIFEAVGKFNYFAAVLYNVPEDKYDDIFVARPYIVHDGVAAYGAPVSASMREVAQGIKASESYNDLDDASKAVIDRIAG